MPVRWDNLFGEYNWNPPDYEANSQQNPVSLNRPMQNRFAGIQEPEYNYGPSERYAQYLGQEPQRADYRPGKFGQIINSLSAGMEAFDSGSLGRASQLYDYLDNRKYDQARQDWATKGSKLKADVDLENTRYRNQVQAVDRVAQRAAQERNTQVAETNSQTALERLEVERERLKAQGWELTDGPGGTQIRINTRTGESQPTDLPNAKLTAEQQIEQFKATEAGRNRRHVTASGSARLGAETSRANTADVIGSREAEGKANREVERWKWQTPSASVSQPKDKVATPTNTRTIAGLVENGYPEFNLPELIQLNGNKITVNSNPDKIHEVLKRLSGGDLKKYTELDKKFDEFKTRAMQLGGQ